jgi:hypothetical protein
MPPAYRRETQCSGIVAVACLRVNCSWELREPLLQIASCGVWPGKPREVRANHHRLLKSCVETSARGARLCVSPFRLWPCGIRKSARYGAAESSCGFARHRGMDGPQQQFAGFRRAPRKSAFSRLPGRAQVTHSRIIRRPFVVTAFMRSRPSGPDQPGHYELLPPPGSRVATCVPSRNPAEVRPPSARDPRLH